MGYLIIFKIELIKILFIFILNYFRICERKNYFFFEFLILSSLMMSNQVDLLKIMIQDLLILNRHPHTVCIMSLK